MDALVAHWSVQPTVTLGIAVACVLYWRGVRYSRQRGIGRRERSWSGLAFAFGLLAVFVALDSPVDYWSDYYLWVHMAQHELLTLVAAPLLLLGAPTWRLWRGVPLSWRRVSLRWLIRQPALRRVWQSASHALSRPSVVWCLFAGVFTAWHLPAFYDFALTHEFAHVTEHLMFLGTALLFWAQVIPSHPSRATMTYPKQMVYVGLAGIQSNVLGSVFMFSTGVLYPYYAALPRSSTDLTVLQDQHFAAAAMDLPATIVFFIAIVALLGLWLQAEENAPEPARARRTFSPTGSGLVRK